MRRLTFALVAAFVLAAAAPVQAGSGLPKLATLQVGHRTVALHSDSTIARTGSNVFTVEVTDWVEGAELSLKLVGPDGQDIAVPLRPVRVLAGPSDTHGGGHEDAKTTDPSGMNGSGTDHGAQDHSSSAPATAHGSSEPAMAHGSAEPAQAHGSTGPAQAHGSTEPAQAHGSTEPAQAHADSGNGSYIARGKVDLPATGVWHAVVSIREAGKAAESAEAGFEAGYAGPHPLYLAGTGVLMGASMLYGVIQKRRLPSAGRK